jgi:hypothetical protein
VHCARPTSRAQRGAVRDPSRASTRSQQGEHEIRFPTRPQGEHEIPTRPQGAEARRRARCTIDDDEQGEQGGAVRRKAERQREIGAAAARPRAERASGLGNGDSGSAVGDRVSRLGLCRESSVGPALLAEGFGPFNGIGSALLALVLSNIWAAVGPTHLSCRAGPKPTGRRICPYPARARNQPCRAGFGPG